MSNQRVLEQRSVGYLTGVFSVAFIVPFCIVFLPDVVESSEAIFVAGVLIVAAAVGAIALGTALGNKNHTAASKFPVCDRFWKDDYAAAFGREDFLVAPLPSFFCKSIEILDIKGDV